MLEDALIAYPGTVLLVTHDRYLIREVADGLIVEQLVQGIPDPTQAALFFLVDHPLAMQVGQGMTHAEAWELIRATPFEIAVTIRPVLVDAEARMTFLLIAYVFLVGPDGSILERAEGAATGDKTRRLLKAMASLEGSASRESE